LDPHDTLRPALSVVIPVYCSEDCLDALTSEIGRALKPHAISYEVVLVNDFSPDQSWRVIESLCVANPNIIGIDLRRNFGQDNSILTGLRAASGQYVAIMDDDLQHHPADLPALLAELQNGYDVVYADFRSKQQRRWKNLGSWVNGQVARWVINKPPHVYLSPYKVMRQEVAALIANYEGPDPYVDGLIFQVTARISQIPVEHHPRFAGSSSYTLWKSVGVGARLAWSFSAAPLRLVTWFGFLFAIAGLLLVGYVVAYRLYRPEDFTREAVGWASLMAALLLVGGVQSIFLGVMGEYIGRTFLRVGNKPQTAVRVVLNGRQSHSKVGDVERVSIIDRPDL
jgi:glycosyltransferase involved in cell wall biosynthesis